MLSIRVADLLTILVSFSWWHGAIDLDELAPHLTGLPLPVMFQGSGNITGSRGKCLRGFTRLILWLRVQEEPQDLEIKKSLMKTLLSISPTSLICFSSSSRYKRIHMPCHSIFFRTYRSACLSFGAWGSLHLSRYLSHLCLRNYHTRKRTFVRNFWILFLGIQIIN